MQLPLITLLLLLPHATSTTFLTIPRGGISPLTSSKIVDLDEAKTFSDVCTGAKKPFPLTIAPTDGTDAAVWAKANKDAIDKLLPEHGAILLRGFKVPDANSFSAFIKTLDYEEQPYIGGNAVRRVVAERVFTSNESPPSERIPFHHEMAQVPKFPTKVFFYCQEPSSEGGETPIVLSDQVCSALKAKFPELYDKFLKEGVKYIKTMSFEDDNQSALGRGWKSCYQTDDKEVAEKEMRKAGVTWKWEENGELTTTSQKLTAIREVDGKMVFFNQVVAAFTGWNDSRNVGEKAIVFGDSGDYLPAAEMAKFVKEINKLAVAFEWEQGDILIIDNRLAMHSRKPFVKPRVVLASLAR